MHEMILNSALFIIMSYQGKDTAGFILIPD